MWWRRSILVGGTGGEETKKRRGKKSEEEPAVGRENIAIDEKRKAIKEILERQMRQNWEENEEASEDITGGEGGGSTGCSDDDGANGVKGGETDDLNYNLDKEVVPI